MITDNFGKPIGYLGTFISNNEVVTINASNYVTMIITRHMQTGRVETQTFYGKNPLVSR
jgi:hypothetical protein